MRRRSRAAGPRTTAAAEAPGRPRHRRSVGSSARGSGPRSRGRVELQRATCASCRLRTRRSTWSSTSAPATTSHAGRRRSARSRGSSRSAVASCPRPGAASGCRIPCARGGGGCPGTPCPSSFRAARAAVGQPRQGAAEPLAVAATSCRSRSRAGALGSGGRGRGGRLRAVGRAGRSCRRTLLPESLLPGPCCRAPPFLPRVLVAGRFAARGLARVVGDVPARPLELDRRSGDELLDRPAAGGASRERRVREFPHQLEGSILRALVLVERQLDRPPNLFL